MSTLAAVSDPASLNTGTSPAHTPARGWSRPHPNLRNPDRRDSDGPGRAAQGH